MPLDFSKAISFFFSILSLYWVMLSAFFVPGSRWQERLAVCLLRVALAACICFASGLLFTARPAGDGKIERSPIATLPVQLFFWALGGMTVLFVLSWYIEEYYIPWALKK